MTRAERNKRLAENAARIAELEKKVEELEDEAGGRSGDQEDREEELARQFEALCRALEDVVSFDALPIALRLDFETMAEQLGVPRPWRPLSRS